MNRVDLQMEVISFLLASDELLLESDHRNEVVPSRDARLKYSPDNRWTRLRVIDQYSKLIARAVKDIISID